MPELTQQQHDARALGFGGSECAAALGVHPTVSRLDLYRHKVFGDPWPVSAPDFNLWLGHELEPVVARCFERETGMELYEHDDTIINQKYPFMRAHVDRLVLGGVAGCELKAWSEFSKGMWGESGTDDVPMSVLCQVVHYCVVTGLNIWYVGALLGTEFRWYKIKATPELVEMVITREQQMWQMIQNKTPPDPVNLADLAYLYERATPGKQIEATTELSLLLEEFQKTKNQRSELNATIDELEYKIKRIMCDAGEIYTDDIKKPVATCRDSVRKVIDYKALERDGLLEAYQTESYSRTLRVKL